MFAGRGEPAKSVYRHEDPDDARDFDDAINVERVQGGGLAARSFISPTLRVLKPGSAIDTDLTIAGTAFTSRPRHTELPERLSNGVCSLSRT